MVFLSDVDAGDADDGDDEGGGADDDGDDDDRGAGRLCRYVDSTSLSVLSLVTCTVQLYARAKDNTNDTNARLSFSSAPTMLPAHTPR